MKNRIYNFSAGPSVMPVPVLERAAAEMLNSGGSGMGVMEMSHRSAPFERIIDNAERTLRKLMDIPDTYAILFLQGGATLQFSMIPINLMRAGKADYAVTGHFSAKAAEEAGKFLEVSVAASSRDGNFSYIPSPEQLSPSAGADYFYLCGNNTVFGTRWDYVPDTGPVPVVADLSSEILSRPIDVRKYGLIFAGAQKNLGPAGLTLVIIRKDLLRDPPASAPAMLQYKLMEKHGSMYNTPPTYAIYMLGLVLDWVMSLGGLPEMERRNLKKASILYDYLDNSRLFEPLARTGSRSIMNVTFRSGDERTDERFVREAEAAGLSGLKGYRTAGGMRASVYNAMPEEGVLALVRFMEEFEKKSKGSKN